MSAVIGKYGMNFVREGGNEGTQEVGRDAARGLRNELNESELGGPVDGDEEIELAFSGTHLGKIDMEVADGVRFEFALLGLVTLDLGGAWRCRGAEGNGGGKIWSDWGWRAGEHRGSHPEEAECACERRQ